MLLLFLGGLLKSQNKGNDSILNTQNIKQIILKSQHKRQFTDKSVYTFDKEAKEKARTARDLVTSLPELEIDPISKTVKSIRGGKTLFLINGIEATDNQIKSINPSNVLRIEYSDVPPLRYAQRADTVVNIITQNPETGYSFGEDFTSAISTGFIIGSAYAGYTKGQNDFGIEYNINSRNYDDHEVYEDYDYDLNQTHYRARQHLKNHFGYTNQNITLRYTRTDPAKYTFQTKLNLELNSRFKNGKGHNIFTIASKEQLDSIVNDERVKYVSPTLDLYYSRKLGKKDELSLNLVGTLYNTKSNQFNREWTVISDTDVFNNDMNLKAKQTGIVGEIAYIHSFGNGKLTSGYRVSNTFINNSLLNLLGSSQYTVNYLEQYLYSEYAVQNPHFSYRFGIGLASIHNKSAEMTAQDWAPAPKMIIGYKLSKSQYLRWVSDYASQSPSADALSNNVVQIAPNIIQKGNPLLKTQHLLKNNLIYSFNNKYFDINSTIFYNYVDRYFAQFYVFDSVEDVYLLTYANAKNYTEKGVMFSGSVKPFGNDLLVLKTYIAPISMRLTTSDGQASSSRFIINNFSVSSRYKNFTVNYQFNFPVYLLSGSFLNRTENKNDVLISYQKKPWTFSLGVDWMGIPSIYGVRSLNESLVDYNRETKIYNNKNMVVIGISFDFSRGKELKVQKNLDNNNAPAATF